MCMFLLVAGSLSFVSEVKISIESALMPVPLFLAACLMVLQMSPGSWCSWSVVVYGGYWQ